MPNVCEYCHGAYAEGAVKCPNCGAAAGPREPPDFRFCPYCRRRLVALGSPACNYCGRALPEEFVKARDAMRQRLNDARITPEELKELEDSSDGALSRALRALLDLDR